MGRKGFKSDSDPERSRRVLQKIPSGVEGSKDPSKNKRGFPKRKSSFISKHTRLISAFTFPTHVFSYMIYKNLSQEIYYIYILLCKDNSYYVGLTNDLTRRLEDHNKGIYPRCYTFKRRPVTLVYYETSPFVVDAAQRETQLKKWSRDKKKMLIEQNYHKLMLLAECQNLSHDKYKEVE